VAVVVPFSVNAGTGTVGAVVSELLAASLDGSLGLRAFSSGSTQAAAEASRALSSDARRAMARQLAGRFGARYYVSGEVFESGERLRITAEFRSRHDELLLDRAAAEGTRSDLFDLVDRVASQLLAGRIAGGRDVVRLASTTTPSLSAAKAYFRAEEAFASASFRTAIDEYEEAVQLDPTFALAHYGLANAAEMVDDEDLVAHSIAKALENSQSLPRRQKRLVSAFLARHTGDVAGAIRSYRQLTTDYPTDAEAWLGLGETLFHLNPLVGEPVTEARSAFEHAVAIDSSNVSAHVHLARIASLEHDEAAARRFVARARMLAPDRTVAGFALHVLSLGVPLEGSAVVLRGRTAAGAPSTDAIALLTSTDVADLTHFAKRLIASDTRGFGLRLQSLVDAGHGRISEALALLDTCRVLDHDLATEAQSRLAALAFIPLKAEEIDRIRMELSLRDRRANVDLATRSTTMRSRSGSYLQRHRMGLIALRLGDTAAVLAFATQLDSMDKTATAPSAERGLATSLRAHLAAARGRGPEALRLMESMGQRITSAGSLESYDRLLRARLLEQAGRDDEALAFYAQLGARSPFELPITWQAELGRARIHARRGNAAMASRTYRLVADRLQVADSTLHH
jgi:tetratricopeptide (TPR) repeat protein